MSKLRKLVLQLIDAYFIGIQLIFKTRRGIFQVCRANHWLEIKFQRLRVHVLHLSTIKFLVVSLPGPHGSLRKNDLRSRGVTLGRLIQIYLKWIVVGGVLQGLRIKSVWNRIDCLVSSFGIEDFARMFTLNLYWHLNNALIGGLLLLQLGFAQGNSRLVFHIQIEAQSFWRFKFLFVAQVGWRNLNQLVFILNFELFFERFQRSNFTLNFEFLVVLFGGDVP